MTAGELRKALEGVPDDMIVLIGYDGSCQDTGPASECGVRKPGWYAEYAEYFHVPENQ